MLNTCLKIWKEFFFLKKKVEFNGNIYISRGWDIYMNIYSRKEFCLRLLGSYFLL